jgi:hypothetical protein
VRHTIIILTILISQNLSGQIRYGTYTQLDTTLYADLKIYPNKTFDFYDTRNGSCWLWMNYKGNWKTVKDTIVFYWSYEWTETADTVIKEVDTKSQNITLTFLYDDGEPIQNVETCYACDFTGDCKKYLSDKNGKVIIPKTEITDPKKAICTNDERRLYYGMKTKYIEFTSNGVQDTLTNDFKIIIKKKRNSKIVTDTKKYLISGNTLTDIDYKENSLLNWGDLKFYWTKYGR